MVRMKCLNCFLVYDSIDSEDSCLGCGEKERITIMCSRDHPCICMEDVHAGVIYCQVCGKPTCPCGSHDVGVTSRVTGYLADLAGFNAAKKQEIKDRVHYDIT